MTDQLKDYTFNKKTMIVFGNKIMIVLMQTGACINYISILLLKQVKNQRFNGKYTMSVVTPTKLATKPAKTATQSTATDAPPTVSQKISPTSPKLLTEMDSPPTLPSTATATESVLNNAMTETQSTLMAAPTQDKSTLAGRAQKSLVVTSASATPTTTPTQAPALPPALTVSTETAALRSARLATLPVPSVLLPGLIPARSVTLLEGSPLME
jgi:hypothetical protein